MGSWGLSSLWLGNQSGHMTYNIPLWPLLELDRWLVRSNPNTQLVMPSPKSDKEFFYIALMLDPSTYTVHNTNKSDSKGGDVWVNYTVKQKTLLYWTLSWNDMSIALNCICWLSSSLGKCGVPVHYHHSQFHSDLEW